MTGEEEPARTWLMKTQCGRAAFILLLALIIAGASWTASHRPAPLDGVDLPTSPVQSVRAESLAMAIYKSADPPQGWDPGNVRWVSRMLQSLVDQDQAAREHLRREGADAESLEILHELSVSHVAILKALLDQHDWFDVAKFGPAADYNAFVIAQHADHDSDFQKLVLNRMEHAAATGGSSLANVAFLTDRLRIAEGELQEFGTQGSCTPDGSWVPAETIDPVNIDARRGDFNLPPHEQYRTLMNRRCGTHN